MPNSVRIVAIATQTARVEFRPQICFGSRKKRPRDDFDTVRRLRTTPSPKPFNWGRIVEERQLLPRASQETGQGVVILGSDGVELVIVASGAGDTQSKKRLAHHVDLVVECVAFLRTKVDGSLLSLAEPPERRPDD